MNQQQVSGAFISIRSYAEEHHVPIMEETGMNELLSLLKEQNPRNILEIGSAIGFSAIKMAAGMPGCTVDTIERDDKRYEKAVEFIAQAGMDEHIRIFHADALEMDLSLLESSYDAIFIDAAKGQYERFFEKYESLLADSGIIYCDNMHMHGMAELDISEIPRRKRTMIRNLKVFKEHMLNHPSYETTLLSAGDGIMICRKNSSKK